jgi:hypothetical protein
MPESTPDELPDDEDPDEEPDDELDEELDDEVEPPESVPTLPLLWPSMPVDVEPSSVPPLSGALLPLVSEEHALPKASRKNAAGTGSARETCSMARREIVL